MQTVLAHNSIAVFRQDYMDGTACHHKAEIHGIAKMLSMNMYMVDELKTVPQAACQDFADVEHC